MISKMSKWVFPIIILFILHNAISQEYKNLYSYKDNKPLYDMDGLPIWTDSLGYITLKGILLHGLIFSLRCVLTKVKMDFLII